MPLTFVIWCQALEIFWMMQTCFVTLFLWYFICWYHFWSCKQEPVIFPNNLTLTCFKLKLMPCAPFTLGHKYHWMLLYPLGFGPLPLGACNGLALLQEEKDVFLLKMSTTRLRRWLWAIACAFEWHKVTCGAALWTSGRPSACTFAPQIHHLCTPVSSIVISRCPFLWKRIHIPKTKKLWN